MTGRALSILILFAAMAGCGDDTTTKPDLPRIVDFSGQEGISPQPDRPVSTLDARTEARLLEAGTTDKGPAGDVLAMCGKIRCDCTAFSTKQNKVVNLWGDTKEVTSFPDFKVRVNSFPQLKVQKDPSFANSCGKWKTGSSFPVFTYQIVTIGEDFTIQWETTFPGLSTSGCPNCK